MVEDVALNDGLPWVEKYRPATLDDVYGQNEVVGTVRRFNYHIYYSTDPLVQVRLLQW